MASAYCPAKLMEPFARLRKCPGEITAASGSAAAKITEVIETIRWRDGMRNIIVCEALSSQPLLGSFLCKQLESDGTKIHEKYALTRGESVVVRSMFNDSRTCIQECLPTPWRAGCPGRLCGRPGLMSANRTVACYGVFMGLRGPLRLARACCNHPTDLLIGRNSAKILRAAKSYGDIVWGDRSI